MSPGSDPADSEAAIVETVRPASLARGVEVIADHLGHLSPEVRTKVLSTNVARLYNFPTPTPL